MTNAKIVGLLQQLRASRFRDLVGARFTADVPVSEGFLNELIATSLPPTAPVRSIAIHPGQANQVAVRMVPKAAFMPAVTLKLAIEQQPQPPDSAVLTLRMVTLGGLFGIASGLIAGFFPPGVALQGDRILVDLRMLAAAHGAAEAFEYLTALRVETEAGRVILHLDATVR
jgi:hypothetical protein